MGSKPFQMALALGLLMWAGAASAGDRPQVPLPRAEAATSATFTLTGSNPTTSALGVGFTLTAAGDERLADRDPVEIVVRCVRDVDGGLMPDPTTWGPDARLMNLTASDDGCQAFDVEVQVARSDDTQGEANVVEAPAVQVSIAHRAVPGADPRVDPPAVFVFNPVAGHWTKAPESTSGVKEPQRSYATLSKEAHRIISGVIVRPDAAGADAAPFEPGDVSRQLDRVDPRSGYLDIGQVEADSRGNLALDMPLMLRPAKGAGPSFGVTYDGQGGDGALGRGWDLAVPTITVRGSTPVFHPGYETEDYVLDGAELIALDSAGNEVPPLHKGGPILRRVKGTRHFRLRNNERALLVRRHGDGPGDYHWEVWDPVGHVTRHFGGRMSTNATAEADIDGDFHNGALRGWPRIEAGNAVARVIAAWGLTQEYDNQPARRGTRYTYAHDPFDGQSNCHTSWGDSVCSRVLRLVSAQYNVAFGADQSGIARYGRTKVTFDWTDRPKARFVSDARTGLFRAREHWLTAITVDYEAPEANLWLASGPGALAIRYSRHEFTLSGGADPCLNYDVVLRSVTVRANGRYDEGGPEALGEQTFEFAYRGEREDPSQCGSWQAPAPLFSGSTKSDFDEDGGLGFPDGLLGGLGLELLTQDSLLGKSASEETGASFYGGVGPGVDVWRKPISGGVKGGFNFNRNRTTSTLIDVTGDGIDDIVFRRSSGLQYCKGERTNGRTRYPPRFTVALCGDILGVGGELGVASTSTETAGGEFQYYGGFAGVSFGKSTNQTYVYFTERDGDGLVDLVSYGRVFYGQGERVEGGRRSVSFVANSALTPPVPAFRVGVRRENEQDLVATLKAMARELDAASRRVQRLRHSETSAGWQAPLGGYVRLDGRLALSPGTRGYEATASRAREAEAYHEGVEPSPDMPLTFAFVSTPVAQVQLSLWRRGDGAGRTLVCARRDLVRGALLDLADLAVAPECGCVDPGPGEACPPDAVLRVEEGDVVTLTTTVDPDATGTALPQATIRYTAVDRSAPFDAIRATEGDPLPALPCAWSDQPGIPEAAPGSDVRDETCLLRKLDRYTYRLGDGALESAPGRWTELPAGGHRTLAGSFRIDREFSREYSVAFELNATPGVRIDPTTTELDALVRLDVSAICEAQAGPACLVDLAAACGADDACGALSGTGAEAYAVAGRLDVRHRAAGTPARNISGRVASVSWIEPPHILSRPLELEDTGQKRDGDPISAPGVDQRIALYLPMEMGDADEEVYRVRDGIFDNPTSDFYEGDLDRPTVSFADVLDNERETVPVVRERQRVRLCHFAEEILEFLERRYSEDAAPHAGSNLSYWDERFAVHFGACQTALSVLRLVKFTDNVELPWEAKGRLELDTRLARLAWDEQISSAEVLLERVLASLALPKTYYTDDNTLTAEGYRLPLKANPFDCDALASAPDPLVAPVVAQEGDCAYRVAANFAMQDVEKIIDDPVEYERFRLMFEALLKSDRPAFKVVLSATRNGKPVVFHELSGAETGNGSCERPAGLLRTCIGSYGAFGLENPRSNPDTANNHHRHPDATGDIFQRLFTNRRTGRAVSFSSEVMHLDVDAVCQRGSYETHAQMEAKQDCPVTPAPYGFARYTGEPTAQVEFDILENNRFVGRNRILEFRARPLDVVAFRVELVPIRREAEVVGLGYTIDGHFSAADASPGAVAPGIALIPRSPADLLPSGRPELSCRGGGDTCRPWSRLGWTELFLGAQYRTYSDIHRTRQSQFSLKRRREMLRLHPMITVRSDRFWLNPAGGRHRTAGELRVSTADAGTVRRIDYVLRRTPNVDRLAGHWMLFATRAERNGAIAGPPDYHAVRYGDLAAAGPNGRQPDAAYNDAADACVVGEEEAGCEQQLGAAGREALDLDQVDVLALRHRFVGPHSRAQEIAELPPDEPWEAGAGVCSAPRPTIVASCWQGADDTVYLHRAVGVGAARQLTSVSALVGFERAPIARFRFQLDAYVKVACNDSDGPLRGACTVTDAVIANGGTDGDVRALGVVEPSIPNRPNPPAAERLIQVIAPVLKSNSSTIARNIGSGPVNQVSTSTTLVTEVQYRDVNGDGYPDVVRNGTAELSSPVGLSRATWWDHFRVTANGDPVPGSTASGFVADAKSTSDGIGVGFSAQTSLLPKPHGANTEQSGSPDAALQPSFDLSFEAGRQTGFNALHDFNGDGLLDEVAAGAISAPLDVKFNAGSALRSTQSRLVVGDLVIAGRPQLSDLTFADHYDASHSAGFGIRLGFSIDSGSIAGGTGLGFRGTSSEGMLIDMTGDGRVDIAVPAEKDGRRYLAVAPNLGNGFGPVRLHSIPEWVGSETSASETTLVDAGGAYTFGFTVPVWFVKAVFTPAMKKGVGEQRELVQLRDINADSVPDLVAIGGLFRGADASGVPDLKLAGPIETRAHYNPDGGYHLLSAVTVPSGARYRMGYRLLGNTGPEHGRSVWALTDVASTDGYDSDTRAEGERFTSDGQDARLVRYAFERGYHNRAERSFYGFGLVRQTTYGCDDAGEEGRCLAAFDDRADGVQDGVPPGYVLLDEQIRVHGNRDWFSQGRILAETVTGPARIGARMPADPQDAPAITTTGEAVLVSARRQAYTIDHLGSLIDPATYDCGPVATDRSAVAWSGPDDGASALSPAWSRVGTGEEADAVYGDAGLCGREVASCAARLTERLCRHGFVAEQRAFWAQTSGALRLRHTDLAVPGEGAVVAADGASVAAGRTAAAAATEGADRLRSANGADFDRWGQILRFHRIPELDAVGAPVATSALNTSVRYAERQAGFVPSAASPHPLAGIGEEIRLNAGAWTADASVEPLRVRQTVISEDGRGLPQSICDFPGGKGFRYTRGIDGTAASARSICAAFGAKVTESLTDGYSSLADALRNAYRSVAALPDDPQVFTAIRETRVTGYDDFGNPVAIVSPISGNREWIERAFSYDGDPFTDTATETLLTRCVQRRPGAGASTQGLGDATIGACRFGLSGSLLDARQPVTHRRLASIDVHHGEVAAVTDPNGHALLTDYDRWGRVGLLARSWGAAPREQASGLAARLSRARAKDLGQRGPPEALTDDGLWRILATVDYASGRSAAGGWLRSTVARYERSDAYSGVSRRYGSRRRQATFVDAVGGQIQAVGDAEVCAAPRGSVFDGERTAAGAQLAERCTATGAATVRAAALRDAMGRVYAEFEPYAAGALDDAGRLAIDRPLAPAAVKRPVTAFTRDAAGRLSLGQSRLAVAGAGPPGADSAPDGAVVGAAQYRYRVRPAADGRGARFEAVTVSPRCAVSAGLSDGRGLSTDTFVWQGELFSEITPSFELPSPAADYRRDLGASSGFCRPVATLADWSQGAEEAASEAAPVRVSYSFDALDQLVGVDQPLSTTSRDRIAIAYDGIGRMVELREPNSGCTRHVFDALDNVLRENRTGLTRDGVCEDDPGEINQRLYDYAADRLLAIRYRSIAENGEAGDEADTVRYFHDRYPHQPEHLDVGDVAAGALRIDDYARLPEAERLIPNDLAARRFVDTAGPSCDNCIGRTAMVADRTGARAYAFDPLGRATREVRSILAPVEMGEARGRAERFLPEVAFYELRSSYSAFGDVTEHRFVEQAPINPAPACVRAGVETCLAQFRISTRYAPDGAVAEIGVDGTPLLREARDALGRKAVRWTSDGSTTGFRYDPFDLRLNRLATLTGAGQPVQSVGYQYDGGGNILAYANGRDGDAYASAFAFGYDGANRLRRFLARARFGEASLTADGAYAFDEGHRIIGRTLTIADHLGNRLGREWDYAYDHGARAASAASRAAGPSHAPASIRFSHAGRERRSDLAYDPIGRLTRISSAAHSVEGSEADGAAAPGVVTNRGLVWDAESRLRQVRGAPDPAAPSNDTLVREGYVYDHAGNRTLKLFRPAPGMEGVGDATTIYMTPFYARRHDGRGAVQIAHEDMPVATLVPPQEQGSEPAVTYLYSDLAVGSMTASVLALGPADEASTTVVARREYSPFGLELTSDGLASGTGPVPLNVFHGKELDRTTGFSSFGARSYSRDLGIWLSPDPMMAAYVAGPSMGRISEPISLSPYLFSGGNPVVATDRDGNIVCGGVCIAGAVAAAGWAWTAYDGYEAWQEEGWTGVAKVAGAELVLGTVGGLVGKGVGKVVSKGVSAARAMYAARQLRKLTARRIAGGHALEKHMVQEFSELGIDTQAKFAKHIERVMKKPTEAGELPRGRHYYYDSDSNTLIYTGPTKDGGTAFRPREPSIDLERVRKESADFKVMGDHR